MTDPLIARAADAMVEASLKLRRSECRSIHLAFGSHVVEVTYPPRHMVAGISIDEAFITTDGPNEADFHLSIIDDSVSEFTPTLDWPRSWHQPLGVLRDSVASPYRFALDIHSRSLSMFDPRTRQAVVWFQDIGAIEYWFAATPFRLQLSWFADTFGAEMIHAAGLEFGDVAALLVGPSGAGKSTLTLSTMVRGNRMLGDDFLLLNGHSAQAVYRRAKVHDATWKLLGNRLLDIGRVMNANAPGEKRIVDTQRWRVCESVMPVAAVFVPRVGTRALVSPLSRPEALRSALGPTITGLLGGSAGTLNRIASLVSSVPTFRIEVGPDLDANTEALSDAMSHLTPVGRSPRSQRHGGAP